MEELMYYVWQQRLFSSITTLDDSPIEIIHPGLRNLDAGPDFFNAKIKMDGMVWAGNIEMHVKASDWFKHNHHKDPAYDNVILHVVMQADAVIKHTSGDTIQTVVMRIPQEVMNRYQALTANQPYSFSAIRCAYELPRVPNLVMRDWMTALSTQRMINKSQRVQDLISGENESWQEALYVMLSRSLGTGINSDSFERLARSLRFSYLQKHLDDAFQVRALLLGQAGLIPLHEEKIQKEYDFLRAKFQLSPMSASDWKMAKRRPQASPEIRIEALSTLLTLHKNLFSEVIEATEISKLQQIFIVPYKIGLQTANSIIINAVVPILLAYGQWMADEEMCEHAISLLEAIPTESNRYMDYWINCGITNRNAFDSQALLQLYKEYCEPHKCMNCRIGCWIVKNNKQVQE